MNDNPLDALLPPRELGAMDMAFDLTPGMARTLLGRTDEPETPVIVVNPDNTIATGGEWLRLAAMGHTLHVRLRRVASKPPTPPAGPEPDERKRLWRELNAMGFRDASLTAGILRRLGAVRATPAGWTFDPLPPCDRGHILPIARTVDTERLNAIRAAAKQVAEHTELSAAMLGAIACQRTERGGDGERFLREIRVDSGNDACATLAFTARRGGGLRDLPHAQEWLIDEAWRRHERGGAPARIARRRLATLTRDDFQRFA